MPDFGSWAADWWKPVLFIVIAGHLTNVCVTIFCIARKHIEA
jgi:stearoyl-CoA desaturase (delta-9 desaturase)